jgi:hypothetical protein
MEEYFYNYNKKKDKKVNSLLLGIFCKNILGYNIFNTEIYNRRNLQKEINNLTNSEDLYCLLHEDDDVINHSKRLFIQVPKKTIIFGASQGDIPIPLIYNDNGFLESIEKIPLENKKYLCSFIGGDTHLVRRKMQNYIKNKTDFYSSIDNWNEDVSINKQNEFIDISANSKFGLAPRGNGRGSFRFYELLKLGVIPIYIWDDVEWLPYKEYIDYSKFSISININDIEMLESKLRNITNVTILEMIGEYEKVKYWFSQDGLCDYILQKFERLENKIDYTTIKSMDKKDILIILNSI